MTSVSTAITTFFYINEPVVDMREGPTHESKVASQAVMSEQVSIKKESENWAYITTPDDYSGWVPKTAVVSRAHPYEASLKVSRLRAHVYGVKDTEYGAIKTLPFGSRLQALDTQDQRWIKIALPDGKECYIQRGDVTPEEEINNREALVTFSKKFLGLPYTWGGRSSFGYDCSGFVQMLYGQTEIDLPRDSKDQVKDDRFQTIPINNLEPGDLIFFGKSEEKITHVGMSIGNEQFIHSVVSENKPWIRISSLSDPQWSGDSKVSTAPYRVARQLK